jgi:hypothetical protein
LYSPLVLFCEIKVTVAQIVLAQVWFESPVSSEACVLAIIIFDNNLLTASVEKGILQTHVISFIACHLALHGILHYGIRVFCVCWHRVECKAEEVWSLIIGPFHCTFHPVLSLTHRSLLFIHLSILYYYFVCECDCCGLLYVV